MTLQTDVRTSTSTLPTYSADAPIDEMMENAQLEALDEDLYTEVSRHETHSRDHR